MIPVDLCDAVNGRNQSMSDEIEISKATAADLSADMEYHRATLANFVKLLVYSIAGFALVLLVLFLALKDRGTLLSM